MNKNSWIQPIKIVFVFAVLFCAAKSWGEEGVATPPKKKILGPSHLMVGPGLFDVDRTHPVFMGQIEYRWEVNCHHVRPLAAFFMTTDKNFFVCGGVGYDIFLGKRFVFTPSFAPGLYYHGNGKRLGFPLNFRSALEAAFVFGNGGRFGAQFNHISNAHILYKNPGANSLFIFYAIPFPQKKKS
ncbi:MAG: acyloxyacyl hydrolase [Verrucomicrobia bacterium]|nr:acyloxyacyl hydrolase [Verrucomicrobiota bacterium]